LQRKRLRAVNNCLAIGVWESYLDGKFERTLTTLL